MIELDLQTAQFLKHKFAGRIKNCKLAIEREIDLNPNSKYLSIALRDIEKLRSELINIVKEAEDQ